MSWINLGIGWENLWDRRYVAGLVDEFRDAEGTVCCVWLNLATNASVLMVADGYWATGARLRVFHRHPASEEINEITDGIINLTASSGGYGPKGTGLTVEYEPVLSKWRDAIDALLGVPS